MPVDRVVDYVDNSDKDMHKHPDIGVLGRIRKDRTYPR
jgi:hypothetical protein